MAQKLNLGKLELRSPAFSNHEDIPRRHARDGDDVAPALEWTGVPDGTKAIAVVMHDPDAPLVDGFTHWVTYGIPTDATGLAEGGDVVAGTNSSGDTGYRGPGPPPGHGPHHYYFWVYALGQDLDLQPGLDRRTLLGRIEDHVIEQARLIGIYENAG
ncbi:MAG: YbhB/YbcL family Raf kinase inhibitor-like protein [Solirubrobacteraceae bacterium]